MAAKHDTKFRIRQLRKSTCTFPTKDDLNVANVGKIYGS